MGQVGSVNLTGAGRFPLQPGDPQEDSTTHTTAESLLQLWHTQEHFAPTTPCPPSYSGAQFPLDFECKEGVKQLQACVDLGQIFKDPGLGRERGGVILSKRCLQTPQRLLLPVPSPHWWGERQKMPFSYF